jgi:hypothetical protein
MDEPHRLLDRVAHRNPGHRALVGDLDDLEAVQGVERLLVGDDGLEFHGRGP